MREGENTNFIDVLKNTKNNKKIILIIDESHFGSDSTRTAELRSIINADITIEMSATPRTNPSLESIINKSFQVISVNPEDVIESGMIKKEIIINENIEDIVKDEETSQDIILEAAFKKRKELKQEFDKIGSTINPLCLIQIPNSTNGNVKKDIIEKFLSTKNITIENGKLAIWLNEVKSENIDDITLNDNKVEFLIFKQAIDTGWDCPRSYILVKLREIKSYIFEIQTLGRILRMPQQLHYDNDILDKVYIFTNIESIIVKKEDYNPNIIKQLKSSRKSIYENLNLISYYKSRVDFGDITASFYPVLENVWINYFEFNKNKIDFFENEKILLKFKLNVNKNQNYLNSLIDNEVISSQKMDIIDNAEIKSSNTIDAKYSDNDIFDLFNQLLKENLLGFAPKRSIPTVREAIYTWFKKYLGINPRINNGAIVIQKIFLNKENSSIFTQLLVKAIENYLPIKTEEVKKKIKELNYTWNVPKTLFYNEFQFEKVDNNYSIFEPCYLSINRSSFEKLFEKYLEEDINDKIIWWYKNGESSKDFFGIKYYENNFPKTFYPDYIVMFKNGKIGIFDVKSGIIAKDAKLKAEALFNFIIESDNSNIFGGIIILDKSKQWRINNDENYAYNSNDLKNWKYFKDLLN